MSASKNLSNKNIDRMQLKSKEVFFMFLAISFISVIFFGVNKLFLNNSLKNLKKYCYALFVLCVVGALLHLNMYSDVYYDSGRGDVLFVILIIGLSIISLMQAVSSEHLIPA